jgi:immune inhibitor A
MREKALGILSTQRVIRALGLHAVVALWLFLGPGSWAERPELMPLYPHLRGRSASAAEQLSMQSAQLRGVDQPEAALAPVEDTRGMIVLLVDFSDHTANAASTPSFYDDLLFSTGNSPSRSLAEYFAEVSYGHLSIFGQVNGAGAPQWYRAPHTYAYYVNHNMGIGTYPHNSQELVEDLVALADPYVDFSRFDGDGDGEVDGVLVIHAGPGYEVTLNPDDMRSHKWALTTPMSVDGVSVRTYTMEAEFVSAPGDSTIGVFCHEFGHVLGLPDLYDRDESSQGLGDWSLMASGAWNGPSLNGARPAHPDAWCKAHLGWLTPIAPAADTVGATIPQAETNAVAYKLTNSSMPTGEYFLVENRAQAGFDNYLPSAGLCIYHVDDTQTSNDNEWYPGHTSSGHYWVALEQADGAWDLEHGYNRGDAGDPWPGSTVQRDFGDTSIPDTTDYLSRLTGIAVQDIADPGAAMTADLIVGIGSQLSGRIMGQVRERGTTTDLVNAAVGAYLAGHPKATTATASDGIYVLDHYLPAGEYVVSAAKAGYVTQTKNHISVSCGATTYVNFNLEPIPSLKGQVRDRDTGLSLVGAAVKVYQGASLVASAVTQAPYGIYQLGGEVPPGTYTVTASQAGYVRQEKWNVVVIADTTTFVNFNLGLSGKLKGQVTDKVTGAPLIGATVIARSGGVLWATGTTTAPWGIYEIDSDLPTGQYVTQASKTGYLPQGRAGITVNAGATTYVNFFLYYSAK